MFLPVLGQLGQLEKLEKLEKLEELGKRLAQRLETLVIAASGISVLIGRIFAVSSWSGGAVRSDAAKWVGTRRQRPLLQDTQS